MENNNQSKKESGRKNGSKRKATTDNQFKKESDLHSKRKVENASKKESVTIKEIKFENKTFKQQPVAVDIAFEELIKIGFKKDASLEIVNYHSSDKILQIVNDQIDWLQNRNIKINKLGFLKKAIKENWNKPENILNENLNNRGAIFAKYFYAGYAGSKEDPVTEPMNKEIIVAEKYVNQLLKICPDEQQVEKWGRQFGKMFKGRVNDTSKNIYISLLPALRSLGDRFYVQQKEKLTRKKEEQETIARKKHQKKYEDEYIEYLRLTEETFREDRREDYQGFLDFRDNQRKEVENTPFSSTVWLADFNMEKTRMTAFQEYFLEELLDFWGWDRAINEKTYL